MYTFNQFAYIFIFVYLSLIYLQLAKLQVEIQPAEDSVPVWFINGVGSVGYDRTSNRQSSFAEFKAQPIKSHIK